MLGLHRDIGGKGDNAKRDKSGGQGKGLEQRTRRKERQTRMDIIRGNLMWGDTTTLPPKQNHVKLN